MPPDKMSSAQAQAVPIIGTVSDPATLSDTAMTQSQNPVAVIASAMKTHGIVPADFDIASIEDEYALMAALRQHTKAAQVKLFDGGIGEDNGADEDYVALLKRFAKACGGAIGYEGIESGMEGDTVTLRFQSGGQEHSWSFEQDGDRVSEEFLDFIIDHSKSCTAGEFINLLDENSLLTGFVPKDISRLLYEHDIVY